MSRCALGLALAAAAVATAGCTQSPITLPLRSLEQSGEVSFVCVGTGAGGRPEGRSLDDCPDYARGENHLMALVTQTRRGEIAVVDLTAGSVLDTDPATPGFNFLPVGANPVSIVSTPGGEASFVGVAEIGKEGIFALPSSCLGPPRALPDGGSERVRDLTSFPACALPSAPGAMSILIDPPSADGERASCDSPYDVATAKIGAAVAASRAECAVDLALEQSPPGRRKLAVALPERGELVIIDAQTLLDQTPGDFPACPIERTVPLAVSLPVAGATQSVPADLQAPGCGLGAEVNYGPVKQSFSPRPSDLALSQSTLFVADQGAPVVHVLDVHDPCAIAEELPLLPVSLEDVGRTVTTTKVAVSPVTTTGKRFAYAVDQAEGSVMVFDVSPGSVERTPIVRPGSRRLPFEAADRIEFSAPAVDVEFALKDNPIADPVTGVAVVGTLCDPSPSADGTVGALYRPSADLRSGAAPRLLRGIFGFVLLSSGQVAVIDEEDFDADCRRPVSGNPAATPDYRGCSDDGLTAYQSGGDPTVSGEVSCNVVEPHRTRSGAYVTTSASLGARAPTLRALPRLHAPVGGNPPMDDPANPKLLAVEFASPGASSGEATDVFVGVDRYSTAAGAEHFLDTNPKTATSASLALPLEEPRAFGAQEDFTLTYEGPLFADRPAGVLSPSAAGAGRATFLDPDAYFCSLGVADLDMARATGESLGVAAADLERFAARHADRLVVTSSRLPAADAYWRSPAAAECGGASNGPLNCDSWFGAVDQPTTARDLRVVEAWSDHLVVEPAEPGVTLERMRCCFPQAVSYTVRGGATWILQGSASGFRSHHRVSTTGRCEVDCNPRRSLLRGRAYESPDRECVTTTEGGEAVTSCRALACDFGGGKITDATSPCVFDSISARFAIYAGSAPTPRDMNYTWTVTGGFTPLVANMMTQTTSVLPQSMVFIPQLGQLAIADGAAAGLTLISLDTVAVSRLYF